MQKCLPDPARIGYVVFAFDAGHARIRTGERVDERQARVS
jgi:hypothetical protein